jgi:hypothetical protein
MVFTINVTYTHGGGPASAKQVQLKDKLPAALVPQDAVVIDNPATGERDV